MGPARSLRDPELTFAPQAATCLGVRHPIFRRRLFDYCIVDEASQMTLPVCLGAIACARTFVLVGDHYQLPPLVSNAEARALGMDVSLFKRLSEAHPSAVVELDQQYRMCESIMRLTNALIYGHRLRCGTQAVAEARAPLNAWRDAAAALAPKDAWLGACADPARTVLVVDTGGAAREQRSGRAFFNPGEAAVVAQVAALLCAAGLAPADLGLVTTYRGQLRAIRDAVAAGDGIEVDTVDRFQGRDKEAVVLSLVRSNPERAAGELLRDWRRVNVAITRARTKLIVVGDRATLTAAPLFAALAEQIERQGGILRNAEP